MPRFLLIGCVALVVAGSATPSRAELKIYLQDTDVKPGGYGVLNVWLGSTAPTSDVFNNYSFQLQITGPNLLEFAPNPSAPSAATPQTQNYSYLSSGQYVFPGDSLFGTTDSNAGALPTNQSNQQFIGFDQSFSLANYAPSNNQPGVTLLASLVLYAKSTNAGEQYKVSVLSGSNTFFNQVDANGAVIGGTDLAYSVASPPGYGGNVSIANAVPEPAAMLSAGTGLVVLAFLSRRHLRSRA